MTQMIIVILKFRYTYYYISNFIGVPIDVVCKIQFKQGGHKHTVNGHTCKTQYNKCFLHHGKAETECCSKHEDCTHSGKWIRSMRNINKSIAALNDHECTFVTDVSNYSFIVQLCKQWSFQLMYCKDIQVFLKYIYMNQCYIVFV